MSSREADALVDYLRRLPGLVSAGVVLQNPHASPREWFSLYEVRWLRGQPVPALPRTIDGRDVRVVVVDDYPRPQTAIAGSPNGAAGTAKTVVMFALFAIPVGIILAKSQEKKQLREEKAEFQRLGLDWNKRVAY